MFSTCLLESKQICFVSIAIKASGRFGIFFNAAERRNDAMLVYNPISDADFLL